MIEGHADERGTREYNLALGDRRASSAKQYLESMGVDGGRVETISYGKERPGRPRLERGCVGPEPPCGYGYQGRLLVLI